MFKYDYTFCGYEECPSKDCKRHHDNMPVGVPVSLSDFRALKNDRGECEYYSPTIVKMNLNTVTEEDLMDLGLSRIKARNIVTARQHRSGFRSVREVQNVRGIGSVTFEKLKSIMYVDWPLEDEQPMKWMLRISDATEWMTNFLREKFPCTWCKLRFEHVDAAAYWFTFELTYDDRRQTWCVRHSDLGGDRNG